MADPAVAPSDSITVVDTPTDGRPKDVVPVRGTPSILAGADTLLDGATHVALSVEVSSDRKPSTLMIPDAAGKNKTVYLTKPVTLKAEKLAAYLKSKSIELPDPVKDLLKATEISCGAFYYSNDTPEGTLLVAFSIKFDGGLIGTLTGDKDLGELFDVNGGSIRVFKCRDAKAFEVLEKYAAELSA
jgi:hypothetical protein